MLAPEHARVVSYPKLSLTPPNGNVTSASGAVLTTRSKPTWCDEHIGELQRRIGIRPLEPFTHPDDWQLTDCLTCTVRAH
jgi:hypothetical protein